MKKIILGLAIVGFSFSANAQEASKEQTETKETTTQTVEASCGQCQFGLTGGGCDLAVRMDGKAYYVEGSSMSDHGNPHAHDGMCLKVRSAEVSGEVKDGKFVATSFKLLPEAK